MRRLFLFSSLTTLLITLFAVPVGAQLSNNQGSIIGELHVERGGSPSRRIQITLETRGALVGMIYADDEGKYGFYGLAGNEYHVLINDPDYAPVDISVEVVPDLNRSNMVPIFLVPKETAGPSGSVGPRGGANAHMMDNANGGGTQQERNVQGNNPYLSNPAEYNKTFPKEAVKEYQRGSESSRKGKIDDAIKHYQKALETAPGYYPAHNDLGAAYMSRGEYGPARTEFAEVVKLNSSDASAYFNLANVSLLTQQYPEGLEYVAEGLRKVPNSATGLFIRGCLDRHAGNLKEAEQSLRDALQYDPSLAAAHLELVNLYRQEENRPLVLAELEAFLKLYPTNPMAPKVKAALEKLDAAPAPK